VEKGGKGKAEILLNLDFNSNENHLKNEARIFLSRMAGREKGDMYAVAERLVGCWIGKECIRNASVVLLKVGMQ